MYNLSYICFVGFQRGDWDLPHAARRRLKPTARIPSLLKQADVVGRLRMG